MPPKKRETGTVAVLATDSGRFTAAWTSLRLLELPPGWGFQTYMSHDPAYGSNQAAQHFEGDRLMLMGDDHTVPQDLLTRLLRHDVDVVAPYVLGRTQPFQPVSWPHLMDRAPGLHRVERTGSAGLLIKRSVFDRIEAPYFWRNAELSEDYWFCDLLALADIPIYVDTTVTLGHMFVGEVVPEYDAKWNRTLRVPGMAVRL